MKSERATTSVRALTGLILALGVMFAGLMTTTTAANAAVAAPTASKKQIKAKAAKPFFNGCKKTGRFNERRFDFDVDAVMAGRCIVHRVRGIELVSSYRGHMPRAEKAIDVMVNMKGSCKAGRKSGNIAARYFMNNAKKHGIRYIIWKNSYWASSSKPTKWKNWRHGMASGSCTTKHFDHVHVSFK